MLPEQIGPARDPYTVFTRAVAEFDADLISRRIRWRVYSSACMESAMDLVMDFVFVALTVVFFALSAGLIRFCAALMDGRGRS